MFLEAYNACGCLQTRAKDATPPLQLNLYQHRVILKFEKMVLSIMWRAVKLKSHIYIFDDDNHYG